MDIRGMEDDGVAHVRFDTEESDPGLAVAEATAALKDVDTTELAAIYDCIDHVVDQLFSDPPDDDANVTVSFDYEGYRVTVQQDGSATFEPHDR